METIFGYLFEVMFLAMFILLLIFPKWELCRKVHLSTLRLTKPKARLPMNETWKYLIPSYSSKSLCELLDIGVIDKLFIPAGLFTVLMFLIATIVRLAAAFVHPYIYIWAHILYWAAIGVFILLEMILAGYVSYLFGKKGCMVLAVLPPISNMVLATQVPSYFKENKDSLIGTFDGD